MSDYIYQAGLGSVDITPEGSIWLHGWGNRDKPSNGVTGRIYCKVLALADGAGDTCVLVTTDLLGFSAEMCEVVEARVLEQYGVPRERLLLNGSHNHSGPVTSDILHLFFDLPADQAAVCAAYTEVMYDRIVEAVGAAIEDMAPAHLLFYQAVAGFGVNRRRSRPGCRHLPGPVDHDVPALAVRSPKGDLRGVVFGYACHATVVDDGTVHGDYPGFAQDALEAMHPGAVCMFVTGCAGDINPLPRYRAELTHKYAEILAAAVDDMLTSYMRKVTGPLRTAFQETVLPLTDIPDAATLDEILARDLGTFDRRGWNWQKAILDRDGELQKECSFAVAAWRFGETFSFITLAGEPVVDYALRLKETYGWEKTWVAGYTHVLLAYIPSLRVLKEGDYEGTTAMQEYGLPSRFDDDVEERIIAAVAQVMA